MRTAPLATVAPTSAAMFATVPAFCALIGCSIFMASRTDKFAFSDLLALLDRDLDDGALHGAVTEFPPAPAAALAFLRPGAFLAAAVPAPRDHPGPRGATPRDVYPDLDDHSVPGLRFGGLATAAAVGRDLVVELGLDPAGVNRERLVWIDGCERRSRTTTRWNVRRWRCPRP